MTDKAVFDLCDVEDLERIRDYFSGLYKIMILKNADSGKSKEGGASCFYEIEIKVKEDWV